MPNAHLQESLRQAFNLSKHETGIYLSALRFEHATITQLAKSAEIPRTAAYSPIKSLLQKGLLSTIKIKKRTHYKATDIAHLSHILERRKIDLEEIAQNYTQQISAHTTNVDIKYYEGRDGIQLANEIFLNESKEKLWRAFENPIYTQQLTGMKQLEEFVKRRVKKSIHGRVIIPANAKVPWIEKMIKKNKEQLREVIVVSPSHYPIDASVVVCGDTVLLMTAKEKPFAMLIKNSALALTFKSMHGMVWDRYVR